MRRLEGKAAVITGGGSGIGEATASRFVEEGARVVLLDIDGDAASRVAGALGDHALALSHDITSEDDWKSNLASVREHLGHLDILVNSAGISVPSSIEEASLEHWRETQSVNVDGVFLGCKYGLELMKETTSAGSIINVSSTLGIRAGAAFAAYSASKAAVANLTRSIALHCAEQGYPVRCNAVHPGAIHTAMMERYLAAAEDRDAQLEAFASVHPLQRVGRPEEVANAILFLGSEESSFITGVSLPVDGGYCAA